MKKSTLLHLRIPFSLFLMPFFCFAASQVESINWFYLVISFLSIHLFLYPASNGYNSYYDKDEESIGGLKNPPPVDRQLLNTSLIFDAIAIILALFINLPFALLLFIYGLISKAYSHPAIRLKKYPFAGLFIVVVFQGYFTYAMTSVALMDGGLALLFNESVYYPGLLCSFLLLGSYPMTQVYQHVEDAKRGDMTISRLLGIKGTFVWTAVVFMIGTALMVDYFQNRYDFLTAILFPLFLAPVLIYFLVWAYKVFNDPAKADWKSTMQLNKLSAICFIGYFVFLFIQ